MKVVKKQPVSQESVIWNSNIMLPYVSWGSVIFVYIRVHFCVCILHFFLPLKQVPEAEMDVVNLTRWRSCIYTKHTVSEKIEMSVFTSILSTLWYATRNSFQYLVILSCLWELGLWSTVLINFWYLHSSFSSVELSSWEVLYEILFLLFNSQTSDCVLKKNNEAE